MKNKITLVGAGGKMGLRLTRNLKNSAFEMAYLEVSQAGMDKLKELQVAVSSEEKAIGGCRCGHSGRS